MTRNLIVSLLSHCFIMLMVYLKEVVHCDLYLQSSVVTRFYLKCNKKKIIKYYTITLLLLVIGLSGVQLENTKFCYQLIITITEFVIF